MVIQIFIKLLLWLPKSIVSPASLLAVRLRLPSFQIIPFIKERCAVAWSCVVLLRLLYTTSVLFSASI